MRGRKVGMVKLHPYQTGPIWLMRDESVSGIRQM